MQYRSVVRLAVVGIVAAVVAVIAFGGGRSSAGAGGKTGGAAGVMPTEEAYPYRSPRFTEFVDDSFRVHQDGEASRFYNWMETAYSRGPVRFPGKESWPLQ